MEKPGFRTSEFFVLSLLTGIALASGFSVVDGVTQYKPNMELLEQLFLAGLAYMGLRGGGKMISEVKKQPRTSDVAKQVLAELNKDKSP